MNTQSGKETVTASFTLDDYLNIVGENEALTRELDRAQSEIMSASLRFEHLRKADQAKYDMILCLVQFSGKALDEIEGRLDRLTEEEFIKDAFGSDQACRDYIDHAKFMEKYHGRKNHRIELAEKWYNKYSIFW